MSVAGVLLAAGAGRRMGGPKALLRDDRGVPFVDRALGVLLDGGCDTVTVVLGAEAEQVRALLAEDGWLDDPAVDIVVADDWDEGMGASLRAGLTALQSTGHTVALVNLVDLPDVDVAVVRRVLDAAPASGSSLARATYDGRPGHPVLLGRDHWAGLLELVHGDRGARDYLTAQAAPEVECADLATGRDVDRPADLP